MIEYDTDQVERIEEYARTINATIENGEEDTALLEYAVEAVIDRALLYLNRNSLDERLEKVVADVVVSVFMKIKNNYNSSDVETAISSISDNGQTVSYSGEVKNYLQTSSDNELFGGFTNVLARYRKARMIR